MFLTGWRCQVGKQKKADHLNYNPTLFILWWQKFFFYIFTERFSLYSFLLPSTFSSTMEMEREHDIPVFMVQALLPRATTRAAQK